MIRTSRILTVVSVALMLTACGSSPPVRYYGLEPINVAYQPDAVDSPILVIGPLLMPEYLTRSQIVSRGSGTEIIVDDFNRWAEPLDQAIHRVIASDVDRLVDGVIVVAFPYNNFPAVNFRLTGNIVRFDTDQSGRALLIVQWEIADSDGDIVLSSRRVHYDAETTSLGDAGASAAALNDTISQFSREIARELEVALRQ